MSNDGPQHLDGNAAAGVLGEVFAFDVTAAVGRCAGCGRSGCLAEALVYATGPGLVVRCAGCEAVLVRLVTDDGRAWLDMQGVSALQFDAPRM
jgi:hypothetical protein